MRGYKAFDSNMRCRDFQFEVGKTYETDKAELCGSGFHFCKKAHDVLKYYPPTGRFALIEAEGTVLHGDDKSCCTKIQIIREFSLSEFVTEIMDDTEFDKTATGYQSASTATGYQSASAAIGYQSASTATGDQSASTAIGYQSASTATGDQSASTATGYQSASTATGDQSASTATGDQSASTATGDQSASTATGDQSASTATGDRASSTIGKGGVALVTGYMSKARGEKGSWIVLSEHDENYKIICVKSYKVTGKKIKANTWYRLQNGRAVIAED